MASNSLTAGYESLPKFAKALIQIFLGYIVGVVYRFLRYRETKSGTTLAAALVGIVGLGFVFWVIDLVTELTADRITFLAQ